MRILRKIIVERRNKWIEPLVRNKHNHHNIMTISEETREKNILMIKNMLDIGWGPTKK